LTQRNLNRFSQVYLYGGSPLDDSPRFRVRLKTLFSGIIKYNITQFHSQLTHETQKECGIEIGEYKKFYNISSVISDADVRDVLDVISIVGNVLIAMRANNEYKYWNDEVSRFFREENLAYRVDSICTVHRFIDEEFDRTTVSAIQSLQAPALAEAAKSLKLGLSRLTGTHQDTKGAITATFEACEILARHLVPDAKNLYNKLCKNQLLNICLSPTAGQTERNVETGIFNAMAEWVDAVHNYRHGQAQPEPVASSQDLAVQLVSMGCSFIRRLAQAYATMPLNVR
jgi:hypothetical protein